MNTMRLALIAAGLLGVVSGEALAQMPTATAIPLGGVAAPVDEATQERRNEVDRNYRATMGTIPAQQGAYDPWAGMRGTEDKAAQKPAAKNTRTTEKKRPAQ